MDEGTTFIFADISIHAPRVGSDGCRKRGTVLQRISIHAPRVGSDEYRPGRCAHSQYFNPRSPCGERHELAATFADGSMISIHAPRVGSDKAILTSLRAMVIFQSTLPVWGATVKKRIFYSNFQFFSV